IVNLVTDICKSDFEFTDFLDVMTYFKRIINVCKQMNYSLYKSKEYEECLVQLNELLAEKKVK
ncbi:MAG: V-type ATP synthase subunit A, partial [Phocaeicola sp.]|nr:V-type ATP synthase subunit A [Phocaeicola sp.]